MNSIVRGVLCFAVVMAVIVGARDASAAAEFNETAHAKTSFAREAHRARTMPALGRVSQWAKKLGTVAAVSGAALVASANKPAHGQYGYYFQPAPGGVVQTVPAGGVALAPVTYGVVAAPARRACCTTTITQVPSAYLRPVALAPVIHQYVPVAVPYAVPVAVPVDRPVPYPVPVAVPVDRPVPYPVPVDRPVPVPVDRPVPVPVDRPVPTPYPVAVPYPVDRPVSVTVVQPGYPAYAAPAYGPAYGYGPAYFPAQ